MHPNCIPLSLCAGAMETKVAPMVPEWNFDVGLGACVACWLSGVLGGWVAFFLGCLVALGVCSWAWCLALCRHNPRCLMRGPHIHQDVLLRVVAVALSLPLGLRLSAKLWWLVVALWCLVLGLCLVWLSAFALAGFCFWLLEFGLWALDSYNPCSVSLGSWFP